MRDNFDAETLEFFAQIEDIINNSLESGDNGVFTTSIKASVLAITRLKGIVQPIFMLISGSLI